MEELAGIVIRAIGGLLHAIFQAILEALFRALFEVVFLTIARLVSAIFRGVLFILRLGLWKADALYRTLVQRLRRAVRLPALAHGLALALLIFGGFACGASASTVYHHVHPLHRAASVDDQP